MKLIRIVLASLVICSFYWSGNVFAQATDVDCNGCVDFTDLADGAVRGRNIGNGHIVSRHIKNGNLITQKFADGAITSEKIAASAVGVTQVDSTQVQLRVGGACGVGSFIVAVAENGSVSCGTGSSSDSRDNTRYGAFALNPATTGQRNTATGYEALYTNTSGYSNTAVGWEALYSNTSGYGNTAIGYRALPFNTEGHSNIAIGIETLNFNTTGSYNTSLGSFALSANTAGLVNTALGYGALNGNTTGNYNIGIGFNAGANISTGEYNIVLGSGNGAVTADTYTTRLGDRQTRAFIAGIRGVTTDVDDAVTVVIDSNGQLGTVSSSARYKDDIQDMGDASSRLLQLRPVTFRYKGVAENGEKPLDYGLIAEEVAGIFPELVVYNEEGYPETVKYRLMSTLLLNELQREHRVNQEQSVEMAELRERVTEVQELQAEVAALTLLVTHLAKSGELTQEIMVASTSAD